MRVALHTIGCKLNQYETEVIREGFVSRGWDVVPFNGQADVYLVNTCTVTKKADHNARRLLRQARRRNPDAIVIAAGCYAQTDADLLNAMPEVDMVLGNADKSRAADLLADGSTAGRVQVRDVATHCAFELDSVSAFAEHTRAFLKIQDGCDDRCAYCKVPLARGPNRSRPFDDAVAQVRRLADSGHKEVVLIGVHLGTYGRDLTPPTDLAALLGRLAARPVPERIRLSSIEPLEFTDELIDILSEGASRICRHLHIPLQSGSDAVLARMNRRYTAEQYADLVAKLAERIPGVAIGADVMVGFPGETEDDLARTRELVEAGPIAYLHVFSYSPREGSPAASMPHQVRPDIIKRRSRELLALSRAKRHSFLTALIGTEQRVLFEGERDGIVSGLTDTYARTEVTGGPELANTVCDVFIEDTDGEVCRGRLTPRCGGAPQRKAISPPVHGGLCE